MLPTRRVAHTHSTHEIWCNPQVRRLLSSSTATDNQCALAVRVVLLVVRVHKNSTTTTATMTMVTMSGWKGTATEKNGKNKEKEAPSQCQTFPVSKFLRYGGVSRVGLAQTSFCSPFLPLLCFHHHEKHSPVVASAPPPTPSSPTSPLQVRLSVEDSFHLGTTLGHT